MPPRLKNPYQDAVDLPEEASPRGGESARDIAVFAELARKHGPQWVSDAISVVVPKMPQVVTDPEDPNYGRPDPYQSARFGLEGASMGAGGGFGFGPTAGLASGALRMPSRAGFQEVKEAIDFERAIGTPLAKKGARPAAPALSADPDFIAAIERAKAAGVKQKELDRIIATLPGPEGALRPVGGASPPKVDPKFAAESVSKTGLVDPKFAAESVSKPGLGVLERPLAVHEPKAVPPSAVPEAFRKERIIPDKPGPGQRTTQAPPMVPYSRGELATTPRVAEVEMGSLSRPGPPRQVTAETIDVVNPYRPTPKGRVEQAWDATVQYAKDNPRKVAIGAGVAAAPYAPAAIQGGRAAVNYAAGNPESAREQFRTADQLAAAPGRFIAGAVSKLQASPQAESAAHARRLAAENKLSPAAAAYMQSLIAE